MMPGIGSE